jgi:hypothetical protein
MFSKIRNVASKIDMRLYLAGYSGLCLPRWLRKMMARSPWHRSWLTGHMGLYAAADGREMGVCDRDWYHYRKGDLAAECSVGDLLRELFF